MDEVAVELMSEQDFDTALELAYDSGGMKLGPMDTVVVNIKKELGLFQPPKPLDPDRLRKVIEGVEAEMEHDRAARARFDEESG